jgi:hypothetical protein
LKSVYQNNIKIKKFKFKVKYKKNLNFFKNIFKTKKQIKELISVIKES